MIKKQFDQPDSAIELDARHFQTIFPQGPLASLLLREGLAHHFFINRE
jgi:hypothetical protein